MGTANKDSISRAGSYNDDPQAKLANDIFATDVGNKGLTDDTGTPIGSLAHDKSGGTLPPPPQPLLALGEALMGGFLGGREQELFLHSYIPQF
jgi:hypothetical protein